MVSWPGRACHRRGDGWLEKRPKQNVIKRNIQVCAVSMMIAIRSVDSHAGEVHHVSEVGVRVVLLDRACLKIGSSDETSGGAGGSAPLTDPDHMEPPEFFLKILCIYVLDRRG